jgi:hypothetical protein
MDLARCPLLGYVPNAMEVEGTDISEGFIKVEKQPGVGLDGYDGGAEILQQFFEKELSKFLTPDLDPLGKKIIRCCLNKGTVKDYEKLIPITL